MSMVLSSVGALSYSRLKTMLLQVFLIFTFLNGASAHPGPVSQTSFSYPSFTPESCRDGTLICMGSVSGEDGYLSLTMEPQQGNTSSSSPSTVLPPNQVGRVLFHQPMIAWPSAITTTFTVRISTFPNSINHGDGMTFIMAQDDQHSPPNSYGSYLGIMDKSTEGGVVRQIAVELDTYANEFDPDANHIGIDTISMLNPVAAKSLYGTGIELASGRDIKVQIDYNSLTMELQVSVAYVGSPLVRFFRQSIDLKSKVPSSVYVGFTASTGPFAAESHRVLNWMFQSTPLPETKKSKHDFNNAKTILISVLPFTGFLVLAILIFPLARRVWRKRKERTKKLADIESRSRIAANVPRLYTYKELSKATHKFSKDNLLGTGGFGSVYKGIISSSNTTTTIAVKKISATSGQGEKEYLAEICTIGRLKHKNIVQLQGSCHEGEKLLLVYEYMPNGSLDLYIGKAFLDWKTRHKILTGLASALLYLHEECGSPVVHRDIKPNNVMLDSGYNAHLGDFGLAKLLQNDSLATTRICGTPGYLAPEVSFTGKATPESDVYSFGMVVIEVVLGRRRKGIIDDNSLVDYVWSLYENNALIEAVDRKLEGHYDEEQAKRALMVGLACLLPDSKQRPKIRKVEQIFLNPNEPLMELPESRPTAVVVSVPSFSSTTTTFCSKGAKDLLQSSSMSIPEGVVTDHEIVVIQDMNNGR